MNNFTFYSPTLFAFGQGEAARVGSLVRQFGGSRVLLVAGGGSVRKNGAYDAAVDSLKEAGIPWCELWGVQANPRSGKVYEGIGLARKEGVDFLLAVGGGSVIDTAKAIGMGVSYDGDFWDFFTGKAKIERTLPVGTEKALDYCVAHKVPTMIFINGMDKENANYWDTVNAVSQKYSTKIVPLMIPLMENGKMTGYANVLEGLFYKVGAHGENGQPLPDSLKSKYEELKGVVMEKAAESDEELLMKFFDSGELSAEEMVKGMKQGVKEGAAIGVFGGSALANFGVFNLMNNLISMMPSAAEAKPVVAFDENDKPTELKPDENAPVVIRIFKTIADPFVGRLSLFKVVSGTLKSGLTLKNASKDSEEKISSIYFLKGKKQETVDAACAGDIGALAKLSNATTGDTLSEDRELRLPPIELPKPVLSMRSTPQRRATRTKFSADSTASKTRTFPLPLPKTRKQTKCF